MKVNFKRKTEKVLSRKYLPQERDKAQIGSRALRTEILLRLSNKICIRWKSQDTDHLIFVQKRRAKE